MIAVGWGEGLDQAARLLNTLPDAEHLTVASPYHEVLQAQFVGHTVDLGDVDSADYAVLYVAATQRRLPNEALIDKLQGHASIGHVQIGGITYADVYPLDRGTFSDRLTVHHVELSPHVVTRGAPIGIRLTVTENSPTIIARGDLLAELTLINEDDGIAGSQTVVQLTPDDQPILVNMPAPSRRAQYLLRVRLRTNAQSGWQMVTTRPSGAAGDSDSIVFPSASVRVQ
jgi:hypothetical protein